MITVYGADWCEDTQRARRHLRRLGVGHLYMNVDEDGDALERAMRLNAGKRRTPVLEVVGEVLVEPPNAALTDALVRHGLLTREQAHDRMVVQNVGDLERVLRVAFGLGLLLLSRRAPRGSRLPLAGSGLMELFSGGTGWCPAYAIVGVTSLGGPGDRPSEAERSEWVERLPIPRTAEPAENVATAGTHALERT